jgi:undecaprenyl diphosphate synthase
MDGNNRWSKKNNSTLYDSYCLGAKNLFKISNYLFKNYNIPFVSAFALSSNNLYRNKNIISTLKRVLSHFLNKIDIDFEYDYKIKLIGNRNFFDKKEQKKINELENKNLESNHTLFIFINYSGQEDIINSVNKCIVKKKHKVSREYFEKNLQTNILPNPDLIVRTGGFQRLSNFMLYQVAFSELYFTKTLWPSFNQNSLKKIIDNFDRTERKFGL